jgi:feruloyl esterase
VSFGETPDVQADGTLLFAAPQFGFISQEGFLRYMSFPVDDPDYYWRFFDFDKDPPKMSSMARILSVSTNLARFRNRGGKIIMYHGWSDTCLSPFQTVDYFMQVRRAMGGAERTAEFLRFFMVPGMLHCAGGPGPTVFDAFGALEDWVEQGNAPDFLIASGGIPYRTRPLCPYPKVAVWDSIGDPDIAESFSCQEP